MRKLNDEWETCLIRQHHKTKQIQQCQQLWKNEKRHTCDEKDWRNAIKLERELCCPLIRCSKVIRNDVLDCFYVLNLLCIPKSCVTVHGFALNCHISVKHGNLGTHNHVYSTHCVIIHSYLFIAQQNGNMHNRQNCAETSANHKNMSDSSTVIQLMITKTVTLSVCMAVSHLTYQHMTMRYSEKPVNSPV